MFIVQIHWKESRLSNEQSPSGGDTWLTCPKWIHLVAFRVSFRFLCLNLLNFSLKSEQARSLRRSFVFKILPVLNPDGVARGYYRLDTKAYNLNRYYLNPSKQEHPTIWATKKIIV